MKRQAAPSQANATGSPSENGVHPAHPRAACRTWLYLAWVTSLAATLGSLFLSLVLGAVPCTLCWYQRICMFPLPVMLGIAVYHDDAGVTRYALPLALGGAAIALTQWLEQLIPGLGRVIPCAPQTPCTSDPLHLFGFIRVPLLSLLAFVIIAGCLDRVRRTERLRPRASRPSA
ncbi:hypothetical protein GCM10010885_09410 [Alicyclobacillus cellulosilyticus]|uniref:Disulfide bond formation protein DsbB n=1 Tax=Alicyclobacillus cellulosilyticus TaxID=1003997 RepID=A0A917K8Q5_9BACL|nr:disulfide bond formation protein B [Alicyclobacillus cellulosilyticus]GGJ02208.1 hypothetical protein GCM10010885_09410 [Alicyclobacillus cellulosilyticus]